MLYCFFGGKCRKMSVDKLFDFLEVVHMGKKCWFFVDNCGFLTTFLCLHKEKFQKKVHQGANGLEFCLRKILHTFSPLESPFDLRKFRHVVLPSPAGEGGPS
jgi:hypothetical protein